MNLYLKHRPQKFDELFGNKELIASLISMIFDKNTIPHVFLLHGPTGCGKTTIARIIAKELGCEGVDFKEIDSADFRGIDTVREIRKQSHYGMMESFCKIWLIDECHKMTNDAQNALLKILEDTPEHVYFILCTTEPQKLIPAIKGRCISLQVNPLNNSEMFSLLRFVTKAESHTLTKSVYEYIIQNSKGLPRNALQILDQVLRVEPELRLEVAKKQEEIQRESIELCRELLKNSSWKKIKEILKGLKNQDTEGIRRHVLGYCESVLINGENNKAAQIIEIFWEPLYDIGFPGLVYYCYTVTNAN